MKNKKSVWIFLLVVLQIFMMRFYVLSKEETAEEKQPEINLSSIDEIFYLIKNEYCQDVNQAALLASSMKALRGMLETKKLETNFTKLPDGENIDTKISSYRKNLFQIWENYGNKINKNLIVRTAISGMLDTLNDPYTVYFDEKEYEKFNSSLSGGDFCGIGIYLKLDKDTNNLLTVVEQIKNSPADRAGIKAKDIIIEIDGISTIGLSIDEALKLLEGPRGSKVRLLIRREGETKPLGFEIVRDKIHISSVEEKLLDGKIGYIKLSVFGKNTSEELDEALRDLEKLDSKGYILDLRNNGGGYVAAAIDVCSKFMPTNSVVVYIKSRHIENSYNSYGSTHKSVPLVVLVNQYSASASEITAGALQDSKVAVLLGVKTFGKGVVQTIYKLEKDGGAVKITTAHYLTPNRRDIDKKGLEPDIKVEMDTGKIGQEDDTQLKKAKEYLLGLQAKE